MYVWYSKRKQCDVTDKNCIESCLLLMNSHYRRCYSANHSKQESSEQNLGGNGILTSNFAAAAVQVFQYKRGAAPRERFAPARGSVQQRFWAESFSSSNIYLHISYSVYIDLLTNWRVDLYYIDIDVLFYSFPTLINLEYCGEPKIDEMGFPFQ